MSRQALKTKTKVSVGDICFYCGKPIKKAFNLTPDHIIPVAKGGSNSTENLVTCCRKCNNKKADYTVGELICHYQKNIVFAAKYRPDKVKTLQKDLDMFKAANKKLKQMEVL